MSGSTGVTLVGSEEARQPVPAKAGRRSSLKTGHLLDTTALPPVASCHLGHVGTVQDYHSGELNPSGWSLKWALLRRVGLGTSSSAGKLEAASAEQKTHTLRRETSPGDEEPCVLVNFTDSNAGLQQHVLVTLPFALNSEAGKTGVLDAPTPGNSTASLWTLFVLLSFRTEMEGWPLGHGNPRGQVGWWQ